MIYFDNAATTFPGEAAQAGMAEAVKYPANPSSTHCAGREAARFLELCREKIAASLGVRRLGADKLILTGSGTESNCLALLGTVYAKKRKPVNGSFGTILLSAGEHPSLDEAAKRAEDLGYTVVRIPTPGGVLEEAALEEALANAVSPVIFAGFMLVNNETGAIYDVKSALRRVKAKYPDALCHCDAVQGYMKLRFTPQSLGADTVAVSAHKIHGTRGAGALYIRGDVDKKKLIVPVLPGGGQEGGYRSGTENLVALGAFAWAAEDAMQRFTAHQQLEADLRQALDARLPELVEAGCVPHIPPVHVPGIVNLSLPGIRSEIMLNAMSGRGICISAGSACSAHSKKVSAALLAFGATPEEMDTAVRLSFGWGNTVDEVHAVVDALVEEMGKLARVKR